MAAKALFVAVAVLVTALIAMVLVLEWSSGDDDESGSMVPWLKG